MLFDGKNLDQWVLTSDHNAPASWTVAGGIMTVKKDAGNIETKRSFGNYQLHLEWRIPANISGTGQARGNSGVFLASTGNGDLGYELQIVDAYQNKTYVNGMAGSIYKQAIPLANPARKPGEWQTYDVVWTAPVFGADGALVSPAYATVFFNGVLVQNHTALTGPTQYIGKPSYQASARPRAHQAAGPRRQKRAAELPQHLGAGAAGGSSEAARSRELTPGPSPREGSHGERNGLQETSAASPGRKAGGELPLSLHQILLDVGHALGHAVEGRAGGHVLLHEEILQAGFVGVGENFFEIDAAVAHFREGVLVGFSPCL